MLNSLTDVKGEEKSLVLIYKIKLHLVLSPTILDSKNLLWLGHVFQCKSLSPLSHHNLGLFLAAPPVTASVFLIRHIDLALLPRSQGRILQRIFPRPFLHPSESCHQACVARKTWTGYSLCIHLLHSAVTGSHSFSQVCHVLFIPLLSVESYQLSGLENSGSHHRELGFSKNRNNNSKAQ